MAVMTLLQRTGQAPLPPGAAIAAWAAVALSEEVTGDKPLGVTWGEAGYVLFRDMAGVVRALEDRCPHRRAPLSLGRMRPDGRLQCGYHGWTFDGETGACRVIPNLRPDEQVPARYAARSFPVLERDGLVHLRVRSGAEEPDAAGPFVGRSATWGVETLSLSYTEYLAAWLDGPELLLEAPGLKITDYMLGDPVEAQGRLMRECGVAWGALSWPAPFVTDYPLILRVRLSLSTGQVSADLRTRDETPVGEMFAAPTPSRRGVTTIRWRRSSFGAAAAGARGVLASLARGFGRRPALRHRRGVDGVALARLLPGPSRSYAGQIAALAAPQPDEVQDVRARA